MAKEEEAGPSGVSREEVSPLLLLFSAIIFVVLGAFAGYWFLKSPTLPLPPPPTPTHKSPK